MTLTRTLILNFLFFLFLFLSRTCFGQDNCKGYYDDLEAYKIKHPNYQYDLEQYLSKIGLTREAIEYQDTFGGMKQKDFFLFDCDSDRHLLCTEINEAVKASISQNKIVIINEGHNLPQNRATVYGLVDFLKSNGYHDIFMETLYWNDSLREKYGIPDMNTGYFSNEVLYADLIRKLISSNVKMHPYEEGYYKIDTSSVNGKLMFVSKDYPGWIPIEADQYLLDAYYKKIGNRAIHNRDFQQALFIYQKVLRDKIGKFIVYCGYAHGSKGENGSNMGAVLRYLTKDKTTVIEQDFFRERSSPKYDFDIYTRYSHFDHPMIISKPDKSPPLWLTDGVVLADGSLHKFKEPSRAYDYYIISPRTKYKNDRPDWQTLNGAKHNYGLKSFVKTKDLPKDYLVLVYYQDEYDKIGNCAVPADVIQVLDNSKDYDLILFPHRKYFLKIVKGDSTITSKTISIT